MINKLTNYNDIKFYENYQLKLPIELNALIPEDDSVRLLNLVLEGLDYSNLYNAGMKLNLYNFIPYDQSLDEVKKAMKSNLGYETDIVIHKNIRYSGDIVRGAEASFSSFGKVFYSSSNNKYLGLYASGNLAWVVA